MKIQQIFGTLLIAFLLSNPLQSAFRGSVSAFYASPVPICGTPQASRLNSRVYLEELKRTDFSEYLKFLETIEFVKHYNSQSKNTKNFWAYNFKTKKYYLVQATLRKQGPITNIWVEDESWNNGYVNQEIVDSVYQRLVNRTNSQSINPNEGIIKIDTTLFGQPPNYDGDGVVDFLILNIIDDFDSTASNSPFIAGYFSPEDQTNNPTSNQMDLMYLDSYPGIYYNGSYHPDRVMATTAHEFQHLIHHHYDTNEETWLNEGLSQLASTYCGYGLDYPGLYLQNTNQSLTSWSGEVKDYARVQLWTLYCAEQLGLNFIKTLVSRPEHGVNSFNIAMQQVGLSGTMDDVFVNWTLANWLNSTSLDPAYGYYQPEAIGLRASVDSLIYRFPQSVSGSIQKYAVVYHKFRGRDSLRVLFSTMPPATFWLTGTETAPKISEVFYPSIDEPGFSEDSSYVLVLIGLGSQSNYSYQAFARYSLNYFELAYDGGQPGINLLYTGIAANIFKIPDNNLSLEKVKFWNVNPRNHVLIRVYESDADQSPGNELISPIDTTVAIGGGWVEVKLPNPVENLQKDENIYVGVEVFYSNHGLGYEDTDTPGYSFLEQNGIWYPLSSFQLGGGEPADGVWLIRAVFSGLVLSDSIPQPEPEGDFHLIGHSPNPQWLMNSDAQFQFYTPTAGKARFELYDVLGQQVVSVEKHVGAGENRFYWRETDLSSQISSGIYFYRIIFTDDSGKQTSSEVRRTVLLK